LKARVLIIIGIVFASIGLGTSAYVINVQSQCESTLEDTHYPRPLTFWNCLEYTKTVENSFPSEANSVWITDEDYCSKWCNQKELYKMGCNQQILEHISKYTNLLDENFDGIFSREWISLPDGISEEKYQECIDFIYEQRSSVEIEKTESENIEPESEERFQGTVKVEGEMAEKICKIVGHDCIPYYIGNPQPDGSLMVGITVSEAGTEKQFMFLIKNETLSYTIRENEN